MDVNWGSLIEESKDAFSILPKGKYTVKVEKAEATTSSTQKLMFKLVFKVINGPRTGSTLFNNITLTQDNPKAVYMFFQNLAALGIPETFLKSDPKPQPAQVAQKMIGAVVEVEIDHRPYQGVDRENVKSMTAVSANGVPSFGPAAGSVAASAGIPVVAPTPAAAPQPSTGAPTPTF